VQEKEKGKRKKREKKEKKKEKKKSPLLQKNFLFFSRFAFFSH